MNAAAAKSRVHESPAERGGWHLDQKVPIGIIIALLLQTSGMVWWAAKIDASNKGLIENTRQVDRRFEKLEMRVEQMESNRADILVIKEQMGSVAERLKVLQDDVRLISARQIAPAPASGP